MQFLDETDVGDDNICPFQVINGALIACQVHWLWQVCSFSSLKSVLITCLYTYILIVIFGERR